MATELQSLSKIFNNRIFRIPDYQRGYAWGDRQLADFWSDLARVGPDRTHYCGQLTLEKVMDDGWRQWDGDSWLVEDAGFEPCFVVDGQQRLTTAIILIHCILETFQPDDLLTGLKVSELRDRYLSKSKGVLQSCLFGYAKDNPSHEFFRTQILKVPSNEYHGSRTTYTSNLANARDFFREQVSKAAARGEGEQLFKALTQRFRFNTHELSDDIDVFVAFETMNNRGKQLSRLELLKNRLIYLSTLAKGGEAEKNKVRSSINAVWRTIYEELGRNVAKSLDDDEFLRAHWIVFFGYDKDEADPLTQFLLNQHFTTGRLDSGALTLRDIQQYANSLQISARFWQRMHFPEDHTTVLGEEVASALTRLNRLGFGVLRPLVLATLCLEPPKDGILGVLRQAERFLLLVRSFAGTRANVAENDSYRMAHDLHMRAETIAAAGYMLRDRVSRHFSVTAFQSEINDLFAGDDKGFYELPGLKVLLFEYEEHLRQAAKATASKIVWEDFRGARNSVEHVYPQTPEESEWGAFKSFKPQQKRLLTNNLGNLVAVSVAKNASLSRSAFKKKKAGTDKTPGFSKGSFSELEIAEYPDWTPSEILDRGLKMLTFIEKRWDILLGDEDTKKRLLKLEFVKTG